MVARYLKMTSDFEITKDSIIADVIRNCPGCIEVLERHNMPCRTCMGAVTGTLAEGACMHDVDVDEILAELRECCRKADAK